MACRPGKIPLTKKPDCSDKPIFNPADIQVPALLILAEQDSDAPLYVARNLLSPLTNAPSKKTSRDRRRHTCGADREEPDDALSGGEPLLRGRQVQARADKPKNRSSPPVIPD